MKFHLVVSGDMCSSIAITARISLSDFLCVEPGGRELLRDVVCG
jgi:hypothetical protein